MTSTPAEAAVRATIAARGPIPFAEFMARALADPAGGYYMAAEARPTRGGDFLTAPELHPIVGAVLARQLDEAWTRLGRPAAFTLVEDGAGAGTLALAILAGLRDDGSGLAAALRYAPREMNPHRRTELRERAAAAHLPLVEPPTPAAPAVGAVLANEFLDALPVHVVELRDGDLREVQVTVGPDGALEEVLADPSTPALAARLAELASGGVRLVEGQRAELCLALDGWAADVGATLEAGLVLVLDYGAPAAALYGPRHPRGTLMTYRAHAADGSPGAPYRDVGERDITAHVDTTTLQRRLAAAGLDLHGETSQAELLVGCGLQEVMERERTRLPDVAAGLLLRGAVHRLLDPRQLGGFRAILAGRGIALEPPLRGLAFRNERGPA